MMDFSKLSKVPFRIGIGQDSHHIMLNSNKTMRLGGVLIKGICSPDSNSDGDALVHALFNAVSSALGFYPVGYYFKGKMESSEPILLMAKKMIKDSGYKILNISISIEAKYPKIVPIIENIKENLSKKLEISPSQIGITATSGEELTSYGKGLGINVFVCILVGII